MSIIIDELIVSKYIDALIAANPQADEFEYESFVRSLLEASQYAALASYHGCSLNDENLSDMMAVNAMRASLRSLPVFAIVAAGEGERDNAPRIQYNDMPCAGVSGKDPYFKIALDPLECTTIAARFGGSVAMPQYAENVGAISVLSCAEDESMITVPDVYMNKLAIGFSPSKQIIDVSLPIDENLRSIANAAGASLSDIVVTVLDRPRHAQLIHDVQQTGAKVKLICDGDVMACIGTVMSIENNQISLFSESPRNFVPVYAGIGGAPEGVIAASALDILQGQMSVQLIARNDAEKQKLASVNIHDLQHTYSILDLVNRMHRSLPSFFVATGVTDGEFLYGPQKTQEQYTLQSLLIRRDQSNATVSLINSKISTYEAFLDLSINYFSHRNEHNVISRREKRIF